MSKRNLAARDMTKARACNEDFSLPDKNKKLGVTNLISYNQNGNDSVHENYGGTYEILRVDFGSVESESGHRFQVA